MQILADEHGTVLDLGERDCSLQTQHYQKMVEEALAPHLDAGVRKRICEAAVKAAPAAGKITSLRLPGGLGVRVDTHIFAGYDVPPYYDSMLAKIIVWDHDRAGAIARMQRALDEVEIGGVKTDLEYHKRILANAFFRKGEINTKFLQTHLSE